MSKWWLKAPILLFCILMIATVVVFGRVAYAATGDPEFALILNAGMAGFTDLLAWLLEMLIIAW